MTSGWGRWDGNCKPVLVSFSAQVCKCTNERVPHFNARLFLENKEEIGKVDVPWTNLVGSFFFAVPPTQA